MSTILKLKKSAGVPVTTAVHRILATANAARARSDWQAAAKHYRSALEQDPGLAHIWIQLGHALKESADLAAAEAAYRQAERLQPANADPLLHLGHLSKLRGDRAGAARNYLAAARLTPKAPAVIGELCNLIGSGPSSELDLQILAELDEVSESWSPRPLHDTVETARKAVDDLMTALDRTGADAETLARAASAADLLAKVSRLGVEPSDSRDSRPTLIFDVADLLAYFRNARAPTGIQRVQMETIAAALQISTVAVRICCFQEQRDAWVEIPPPVFLRLCRLSLGDAGTGVSEWQAALTRAVHLLFAAPPLSFPKDGFLINLGTSWWQQNYFLFVRQARIEHGVRYIPFVHDMIPLLCGEHCPKTLREEFISWAIGVFEHASFFFVNSQSTKRDLLKVGAFLGHQIDPEAISVIPLDADHRKTDAPTVHHKPLQRWGLDATPYVLIVSTIEPRKNHVQVFEAWIALLKRHGPRRTPKLLCVGHPGWMNESIHERLNADEALRNHVQIVSFVSDAELAELYRHCLFTVYPSHYEGWGLPVTESLCHGKVPLVAETSSLPEAGGPFAVYFDADSNLGLVAALETLIFDQPARRAREQLIENKFRPRTWGDLAQQMADSLAVWQGLADPPAGMAPPTAVTGAYYSLRRNRRIQFWPGMRCSEIYRAGVNWWAPDDWGCWTKPGSATLRIAMVEAGALRVYLRLQGPPSTACPYTIASGAEVVEGELRAHETKWVTLNLADMEGESRTIDIEIRGLAAEDLSVVTDSRDPRTVSVGVAGFFLCRADDAAARAAFLEAVALGNVDDLDVNRAPADYIPLI